MKGVPIKFRAKLLDGDTYVYGDLIHGFNEDGDYDETYVKIAETDVVNINDIVYWDVDYKTVAQLCGYDSNGNEIYEGDTLICEHDTPKFLSRFKVGAAVFCFNDNALCTLENVKCSYVYAKSLGTVIKVDSDE